MGQEKLCDACHYPESGMLSSSGENPISTFAYHANTIFHGSKFIFQGGLLKGAGSFSFFNVNFNTIANR